MNNETEQIFLLNPSESQQPTTSQKSVETPLPSQDVEDFSTMCRTCATVTEFVIPIFEGEGLQNNLAEKIHKHLPIQVSETDVLPRVVCYQCASTLLAWHELVQCCEQADAALRARLCAPPPPPPPAPPQEPEPISKEVVQDSDQDQHNKRETHAQVEIEIKIEPDGETTRDSRTERIPPPDHVTVGEDGRRYAACPVCDKSVAVGSWRRHARSHRGEKRYSCHTCGLAFSDSGNLARHARALHGHQRPHRCHVCHKTFSRKGHLEDHLRSHSDSRDFVCDVCGKASKSGAALRMHSKVHDACKFQCMECGARFKRRGELRAHVSVHTGERAHACRCGRRFRLRSQLTAHARTHAHDL